MKETTDILEGDQEFDIITVILRSCGIKSNDRNVLTLKNFEDNLANILENLDANYYLGQDNLAYLILGYFIVKLGAHIPENLRKNILEASLPENDTYRFHDKEISDERQENLRDIHEKILHLT